MRWPLLTIAFMLSLGFVTRYGGTDATLGLAFTKTGWFYPFFAAMLGWLGVALTGSDTSSNVLFGSLQKITAQQLGLDPILITTANSTGGVMGKMIDAQSIVVATAATNQHGQEGRILRFVFWHSVALAVIMGIIVMLQAYVFPWMVPAVAGGRLLRVFRRGRRFEADDEILARFDLLVVEAGNLLELVERLADADLVEIGKDRRRFLPGQAGYALELDVRGPVDVERTRRLAEKVLGQVLEDRAEFLVSALGATLDHVGDDFLPALARQAHGRRPLRLVAGAADFEEGILPGPVRKLSRGRRAQSQHET